MTRVHKPRPPRESTIFDDVVPDDIPASEFTANARLVLSKRYLKKDAAGTPVKEPETMFWRVAKTIADVDADYGASEATVREVARSFYDLMINGKFVPNSPTLMNAGRPLGQLSACFLLPVADALSHGKFGIYDTPPAIALVPPPRRGPRGAAAGGPSTSRPPTPRRAAISRPPTRRTTLTWRHSPAVRRAAATPSRLPPPTCALLASPTHPPPAVSQS